MVFFDKGAFKEAAASERQLEDLFKQASERGAVLALFHFDVHGKSADAVKNFLVDFIARLSNEPGILYCKGEIEEVIEREGVYSTCSEVKLLGESFSVLLDVAMRYGPIAVEVLLPTEIRFDVQEMQDILLDASKMSMDYAKYILERTLSPEDVAFLQKKMEARAELGKKLAESGGGCKGKTLERR